MVVKKQDVQRQADEALRMKVLAAEKAVDQRLANYVGNSITIMLGELGLSDEVADILLPKYREAGWEVERFCGGRHIDEPDYFRFS
jgi:hypothetical protein